MKSSRWVSVGISALAWMLISAPVFAQKTPRAVSYGSKNAPTDIPSGIKDLIKNAKKKTVFEVVGLTTFSDQVLKTDKLIFEPGATLALSSLRSDSLVIIAGEIVLQDPKTSSQIIRDPSFQANAGSSGAQGGLGQPDYTPPHATYRSANGGPGGAGGNGTSGEVVKPPTVYLLVGKMNHPAIPSRFIIDFGGVQGGPGGSGGTGGTGGHGDVGWPGSSNFWGCQSGPGRGGDGGPGGLGGRGADAVPGGPGFDLLLGGQDDFVNLADQFTIINKGGDPGAPGVAGRGGAGGQRGQGGQTTPGCSPRGDGVDGAPGGSQGPGSSTTASGAAGLITFAYGLNVSALLGP